MYARDTQYTVLPGPRYIPDSLYTCLCQVSLSIYPGSHLISYLSLRPPYLGRHQNGSQRTVVRTRRPSPEPDNDRLNNQPANTTNDSINRSIELNQSFDIGLSPNRIKASQGGTPDKLNQAEPLIRPTFPPNYRQVGIDR